MDVIHIRLNYMIIFENKEKCYFDGIECLCDELNYLYPITDSYTINDDLIFEGKLEIKIKGFDETTTKIEKFTYKNEEIPFYFNIIRKPSKENTPISLISSLVFQFKNTNDYNKIYTFTYEVILNSLRFLCNRKDIKLNKLRLRKKLENGKYENSGELIIFNTNTKSIPQKLLTEKIIPIEFIKMEKLFELCGKNDLYLNHLPDSIYNRNNINEAIFILRTSAFEWEFKKLFPKGIQRSDQFIKCSKRIKKIIENKISNSTGKEKEIWKYLKKRIFDNNLSAKLTYFYNQKKNIIDKYCQFIYENSKLSFDIQGFSNVISTQRNNFAHGNLDKDFNYNALVAIVLLERLIYIMQLIRLETDENNIDECMKYLFKRNI